MKNCKSVISILGEITPLETDIPPVMLSTMLCYTINISPNTCVPYEIGLWGEKDPDEQNVILKKIHKRVYVEMNRYLSEEESYGDNKVWFEFTKSGELHSHGYFILKEKFSGYDRYVNLFMKKFKTLLPRSNYAVVVKWAEDKDKWVEYCSKDEHRSGYKPYSAEFCENVIRDICWYFKPIDP